METFGAKANAFGIGAAIFITLLAGLVAYSPNGRSVAAVFPPWWNAARAFQAAASVGTIVGTGRFGSSLIVRDDRAGLAGRLRTAGALFTFDAGLFGGCRAATVETRHEPRI